VIHLRAQSAFRLIAGIVSMAWNSESFSLESLMYVSIRRLYISMKWAGEKGGQEQVVECAEMNLPEWMFSMAI
jgi:hypothetical protein